MSMVEEFAHTKEEHFGALIFRAILVDMKLDGKRTSEGPDLTLNILYT